MASQKLESLYVAATFKELVDQARDVRKQLNRLEIGHSALERYIGCLSGETIMIEEDLSTLQEYCMQNKDISRRDPAMVLDVNSTLFITSVTLSYTLAEATKRSIGSTTWRPSLYTRFLMSSNNKSPKYDGIDGFLYQIFGCSNALRVLCRLLDPFERGGLHKEELSKYKDSIISKLIADTGCRFGTTSSSQPDYVRSLWPKRSIVYPLTSELMSFGLSQQQVREVYRKSNQKAFIIKRMITAWKSYGSEDDYRNALVTLVQNDGDIQATDEMLTMLLSHGRDLYSVLLKALQSHGYRYGNVVQWLSDALYLTGLDQSRSSSFEHNVRRHLHNALVANQYRVDTIRNDLANIQGIEPENRSLYAQSAFRNPINKDTRFSPVLYLQSWEYHKYKMLEVRLSAVTAQSYAAQLGLQWTFEEALLALSDYSFNIGALTEALCRIGDDFKHVILGLIERNIALHSIPRMISAAESLANRMGTHWRVEGLARFAQRCDFDLEFMLNTRNWLEAGFPAPFVESRLCWDWLAFNGFDLAMTMQDAVHAKQEFLSWGRARRRDHVRRLRNFGGDERQLVYYGSFYDTLF
ncbi:hypothetical protein PIIN_01891 [Serendipita indica DSM 11827]|uniref:Uncharacterized protein n=1 Tax=Serendipita indica (strain DSM 11827) TaxID=1109443 RepID=G4T9Q2_SERID|nr:hypothetical protein PIIN_01891 [Serendipita indica DSM 11827]